MFQQLKNIDTAFKQIRTFCFIVVIASVVICCFTVVNCLMQVDKAQQKVYVLSNGKALEAFASDRKDNIPVEARDHIKMFHQYFFSLSPDDKAIEASIRKALYLADATAKKQYDDLKEGAFYNSIISGNISQELLTDSMQINLDKYPYYWRFYGKQRIIRPTAIVLRNLITEGYLRNVTRTDNNPHGFLIERWSTLENKDISVEKR